MRHLPRISRHLSFACLCGLIAHSITTGRTSIPALLMTGGVVAALIGFLPLSLRAAIDRGARLALAEASQRRAIELARSEGIQEARLRFGLQDEQPNQDLAPVTHLHPSHRQEG